MLISHPVKTPFSSKQRNKDMFDDKDEEAQQLTIKKIEAFFNQQNDHCRWI